jgi:hypothetical protein
VKEGWGVQVRRNGWAELASWWGGQAAGGGRNRVYKFQFTWIKSARFERYSALKSAKNILDSEFFSDVQIRHFCKL